MAELSPFPKDGWADVISEIDEKHQKGHDRLRIDLRELQSRVENNYHHFDDVTSLHRAKISTLEATAATPIDATKLVMSTKAIVAVVGAAITIAASIWSLSTKIDAQQKASEATAKLAEMQMAAMRESITMTQRQYELLRYEVQQLKETVINKGKTP